MSEKKVKLPVVLMAPTADGKLMVRPMPQAGSGRYRTTQVSEEYLRVASQAAARSLGALGVKLNEAGVTLHFIEPVDDPVGAVYGFAGFFSAEHPDTIYIVAPWVSIEALPWLVAHETAHAGFYQLNGPDGSDGPDEVGPSEEFADAFATGMFGESPLLGMKDHPRLTSMEVDGESIGPVKPAITVSNAGATVIIDGSSNMFKIQAQGTLSVTQTGGSSGENTATLTGLGTFSATPAHLSFGSPGSGNTAAKVIGGYHESIGGTTNVRGQLHTLLNGSSQCVIAHYLDNNTGSSKTHSSRYYILKEAGI